jgi:hypothetical protein
MRRVAAATALLLVACSLRMPFSERMFFGGGHEVRPAAADCERCHQEVYDEWQASAHAQAWTSARFQNASARGRAEACTSCHAAAPIDATDPVALRDVHQDEGVTCVTCHLSTRPGAAPLTMRGPASRTSPIEIHPIVEADAFYRDSALCGRCHAAELAEWEAASAVLPERHTCQECHMPEVRRKVESVHDEHAYSAVFVALGRAQDLRRHDFAVPADAEKHLRLELRPLPDTGALEVTIANAMPHALPTGRFGRREVALRVETPGGAQTLVVAGTLAGRIEAGEERPLVVTLPAGADPRTATATLVRWDRSAGAWRPLVSASPLQAP